MVLDGTLVEKLKRKTAIIDTCVLGKMRHNVKHPKIKALVQELQNASCTISINDFIKIEFLRDSNHQREAKTKKEFLEELCEYVSLPIQKQVFEDAVILSSIYAARKCHGVDFVDLITSALLKSFTHENGLVLMTANHKDFPLIVHDRIDVLALDLEKEVIAIGFYRVNPAKWAAEEKALMASPEWNQE